MYLELEFKQLTSRTQNGNNNNGHGRLGEGVIPSLGALWIRRDLMPGSRAAEKRTKTMEKVINGGRAPPGLPSSKV